MTKPTISADIELLPCPMCGKQPEYLFSPEQELGEWDTHNYYCYEPNSHKVEAIGLTKEEAIKIWNTRYQIKSSSTIKLQPYRGTQIPIPEDGELNCGINIKQYQPPHTTVQKTEDDINKQNYFLLGSAYALYFTSPTEKNLGQVKKILNKLELNKNEANFIKIHQRQIDKTIKLFEEYHNNSGYLFHHAEEIVNDIIKFYIQSGE